MGKKKPLIVMTGSVGMEPERHLERVYYYRNYPAALEAFGAMVLNVSRCDPEEAERLAALADGLYLTGGGDMAPGYYGEAPLAECGAPEKGRDQLELVLGRAFLEAEKPIFGICRGMQVINVLLGGTLWQDLPSQTGLAHPDNSVHWVQTAEGGLLRSLFGERFQVNSFHHQAVKKLAPGLRWEAVEAGGKLVEAFSHEKLPVWAVQWHPERMTGEERMTQAGPDMAPLFEFFCRQCEGRQGQKGAER